MATFPTITLPGKGGLILNSFLSTIKDAIGLIRTPASFVYSRGYGEANITFTSTAYAEVDSTNLKATLDFSGNPVLVIFRAGRMTRAGITQFSLSVDATEITGADGNEIWRGNIDSDVLVFHIFTGISAGSHTIALLGQTASGTVTLFSSGGIQFLIREL